MLPLKRTVSIEPSRHKTLWVRGLMDTNVGLEFRNQSSIPIMGQIMDDGLRQVVYTVP